MTTKYPKTYHSSWSPEVSRDDKVLFDLSNFLNKPLVLSEKLDGSNVFMSKTECFARSHSGPPVHESFNMFKQIHASVKHLIPDNTHIFAEYTFAKHSIFYDNLPGYLHPFAVKMGDHWCSWDQVGDIAEKLSNNGFMICRVPELAKVIVQSEEQLKKLSMSFMDLPSAYGPKREGVVIRLEDGFPDNEFQNSIVKIVRAGHVETDKHWKSQKIVPNKLVERIVK